MGGWGALPDPGASSVSPEAWKGASPCPHLGDSRRPLAVTARTEGSGLSLATNVLPGRLNLASRGAHSLGLSVWDLGLPTPTLGHLELLSFRSNPQQGSLAQGHQNLPEHSQVGQKPLEKWQRRQEQGKWSTWGLRW